MYGPVFTPAEVRKAANNRILVKHTWKDNLGGGHVLEGVFCAYFTKNCYLETARSFKVPVCSLRRRYAGSRSGPAGGSPGRPHAYFKKILSKLLLSDGMVPGALS